MPPATPQPVIIPSQPPKSDKPLGKILSPWTLVVVLLLGLLVSIVLWKPWQPNIKASDRTIEVTGSATVRSEPDQYIFYPSYEIKDADSTKALDAMVKKSEEVVFQLKKLGVPGNDIQTNATGYKSGTIFPVESSDGTTTYTLNITATIDDKELAQKVQDYLVTTSPVGAITPQAGFSSIKRKKLEEQARSDASKDARSKAEQMATNLGFKLGAVKVVSDGAGFGEPIPLYELKGTDSATADAQLTIQPGVNELSYTITVSYFIK